eukprot:6732948-Prymnesium_polylepis.2
MSGLVALELNLFTVRASAAHSTPFDSSCAANDAPTSAANEGTHLSLTTRVAPPPSAPARAHGRSAVEAITDAALAAAAPGSRTRLRALRRAGAESTRS